MSPRCRRRSILRTPTSMARTATTRLWSTVATSITCTTVTCIIRATAGWKSTWWPWTRGTRTAAHPGMIAAARTTTSGTCTPRRAVTCLSRTAIISIIGCATICTTRTGTIATIMGLWGANHLHPRPGKSRMGRWVDGLFGEKKPSGRRRCTRRPLKTTSEDDLLSGSRHPCRTTTTVKNHLYGRRIRGRGGSRGWDRKHKPMGRADDCISSSDDSSASGRVALAAGTAGDRVGENDRR